MKLNLERTHALAMMFQSQAKIRELINKFARSFLDMVASQNFDIRTIEFEAIIPNASQNKIVLTLQRAEYLDAPLKEIPPHVGSPTYQLVRKIQSFYSSFLAENERAEGLVEMCPGFCQCLFAVAAYLLEYTGGQRDLKDYSIECGDNPAGDLCFFITVNL